MLITLVQKDSFAGSPLTIDVPEDRVEAVIRAMTTDGWHLLSKHYGPASPVVDCLQVALLQVSALPEDAPIRVAVELGASAAIVSAPSWAANWRRAATRGAIPRDGQDVTYH